MGVFVTSYNRGIMPAATKNDGQGDKTVMLSTKLTYSPGYHGKMVNYFFMRKYYAHKRACLLHRTIWRYRVPHWGIVWSVFHGEVRCNTWQRARCQNKPAHLFCRFSCLKERRSVVLAEVLLGAVAGRRLIRRPCARLGRQS